MGIRPCPVTHHAWQPPGQPTPVFERLLNPAHLLPLLSMQCDCPPQAAVAHKELGGGQDAHQLAAIMSLTQELEALLQPQDPAAAAAGPHSAPGAAMQGEHPSGQGRRHSYCLPPGCRRVPALTASSPPRPTVPGAAGAAAAEAAMAQPAAAAAVKVSRPVGEPLRLGMPRPRVPFVLVRHRSGAPAAAAPLSAPCRPLLRAPSHAAAPLRCRLPGYRPRPLSSAASQPPAPPPPSRRRRPPPAAASQPPRRWQQRCLPA